jgi:hypothetical protein
VTSQSVNPYESNAGTTTYDREPSDGRRWPVVVAFVTCAYYVTSALTLPFADDVWIGEASILAIVQIPKSFLKSVVHEGLMALVSAVGWSRGSHSPDYIATHYWAMAAMTSVPGLAVIALLILLNRVPRRRLLIAAVSLSASLDAIVTFWFEHNSRLSLYNTVFF